jgi:hypothetical protein
VHDVLVAHFLREEVERNPALAAYRNRVIAVTGDDDLESASLSHQRRKSPALAKAEGAGTRGGQDQANFAMQINLGSVWSMSYTLLLAIGA